MEKLYFSLMESFQLDFFRPETGLEQPLALTCMADDGLKERMQSATPPNAVLMDVREGLCVLSPDGKAVGSLDSLLRLIRGKAYPILRFESAGVGMGIARYCDENNLGDATVCVAYARRHLLNAVRAALPLSRGMLDMRGEKLPQNILTLSDECQLHEATQLLLGQPITRAQTRMLQKRFIQTWVMGNDDPAGALCSGARGVVTQDLGALCGLLGAFPANSTVRPIPLYAHKALHATGEFPENSTAGACAAGRYGYDGAEIDIQFSKDHVLLVHHDRNTQNLYDGDLNVWESEYEQISALRRKAFPDYGMDRFSDLMTAMAQYPECPVVVEIKTPPYTYSLEECVRQMQEMIARGDAQQYFTIIMGRMPPYLQYVHKHLPTVPLAHCCAGLVEEVAANEVEANNQVYLFAAQLQGANAGFNAFQGRVNALLGYHMMVRGITMFVWTYAFKPWEEEKAPICASVHAGYDGLTSDWVHPFAGLPIDLLPELPESVPAGQAVTPAARLLLRTGETAAAQKLSVHPLEGEITLLPDGSFTGRGAVRVMLSCNEKLPDGSDWRLCSLPVSIRFD